MPKLLEFQKLGLSVEVPDDITPEGIDDVYNTLAKKQLRAEQGRVRAEAAEAQTRSDVLDAYENDPEIPVLMRSELARRVAGGMANMAGSTLSAASMLLPGETSKKLNAYGKEVARMGDIASTAPGSIGEIEDVGDAAGFAGRMVAEQIPQLLLSGATGGTAFSALKAAGMAPKAAAAAAAAIGPVATTFPQEAGSIYQDITDETGETGFRQRAAATAGGALSAGLEAFGAEGRILKNLGKGGVSSLRGALKKVGTEALKSSAGEGLTEAGQESIAMLSGAAGGGNMPTAEEFGRRAFEAGVGGAVAGGLMGGSSASIQSAGSPGVYAAALQDRFNPQDEVDRTGAFIARDSEGNAIRYGSGRNVIVDGSGRTIPGINAEGGLQPYTGARIEQDRPAAFRANPNDIDSLEQADEMAAARVDALNRRQAALTAEAYAARSANDARRLEDALQEQALIDQEMARYEAAAARAQRRAEEQKRADEIRARRNAIEEGLNAPQDSGKFEDEEPRIGQYPPEGFGTGVIPSAEEEERRAAVRERVALRNRQAAEAARAARAAAEEQAQRDADAFGATVTSVPEPAVEAVIAPTPAPVAPVAPAPAPAPAPVIPAPAPSPLERKAQGSTSRVKPKTTRPARIKISPPTDISLPADTGAPSTGGVQTGAPVLPSNVTQGQAPAASPAPAIKPAKTKAPRRAANAPTAEVKAVAPAAPASGFKPKPYSNEAGDVIEDWTPSNLDPNNPPTGVEYQPGDWVSQGGGSYVWRAMGRAEYEKLMAGQMRYGGGKTGRGNYLAEYPEKASRFKGSSKEAGDRVLVEFAGANPVNETSKNIVGRDNVTKAWVLQGGKWVPMGETQAANPSQPQVAAPTYQDGAEVKVGDYVQVKGLKGTGNTVIKGEVIAVRDGKPVVSLKEIGGEGENVATRAGYAPNQEVSVDGKTIVSKSTRTEKAAPKKRGPKPKLSQDDKASIQARINSAAETREYFEYARNKALADKGDPEAADNLQALKDRLTQTPEGTTFFREIIAAYAQSNALPKIQEASRGMDDVNEGVAVTEYIRSIYQWLTESTALGFSTKRAAKGALLKELVTRPKNANFRYQKQKAKKLAKTEAEKRALAESELDAENEVIAKADAESAINAQVDKNLDDLDDENEDTDAEPSSSDVESDETELQPTNKPKDSGVTDVTSEDPSSIARGSEFVKAARQLPYLIEDSVNEYRRQNKGKLPSKPKLSDIIYKLLEDVWSSTAEGKISLRQSAQMRRRAQEYANEIIVNDGLSPVSEVVGNLFANKDYTRSNGRKLSLGELSLSDAIDYVLDTNSQDNLLRTMAQKLLKAGVTARVVVLNDADFDLLGAPAGEVAFYDSNPTGNKVYIRQSAAGHDYIVMHEAIHAATVHALRTNVSFRNEIGRLRAQAIEALGDGYYGLKDHGNNFTNLAEFISEGFTNAEFRQQLDGITDGGVGLWTKIKNAIAKLFGFDVNERSILDALADTASNEFAPDAGPVDSAEPQRLYAAKPYTTAQEVIDALKVPDSMGQEAITISARATQQLVQREVAQGVLDTLLKPEYRDFLEAIESEKDPVERKKLIAGARSAGFKYGEWLRSAERAAESRLKSILAIANLTDEEGLPISDITDDPRMKREAAFVVDRTAQRIEEMKRRAERNKEQLSKAADNPEDPLKKELERLKSVDGMIATTSQDAIADYRDYLADLKETARLNGQSFDQQVANIATNAQRLGTKTSQIGDAIETIASGLTEAEINSTADNEQLVKLINDKGLVSGSKISTLLIPANDVPGLLQKYRGLKNALLHIRELQRNRADVEGRIDAAQKEFAAAVGKKKAGQITLAEFARAYARLIENLGAIGAVNRKIARRAKAVRVLALVDSALNSIVSSPEYVDQRNESVSTLDKRVFGINGRDEGNEHIIELGADPNDPTKLEQFRFLNTVNRPADAAKNAETYAKLMAKIDAMIEDPATSPELRNTLLHKKLELEVEKDDRVEGSIALSLIDPLSYFRRLPWVKNFMTANLPAWLMNGRLGKRVRSIQDAIDRMHGQIKDLRNNVAYGRRAIVLASWNAVQSHAADMPAGLTRQQQEEWWTENVLEEVLSQNQNIKEDSVKVGDFTRKNIKVTKEDLKAAELMAKWNDSLRKIIESTDGIAKFFPTRITEVINGITYSRLAYATSSLTVPRLLNRLTTPSGNSGSPMDLANKWSRAGTNEEKSNLLNDQDVFDTLALAHVAELNSEYKRTSKYDAKYKELTRNWRKTGAYPTNIDDLIDQIGDIAEDGEETDLKREEIRNALISEIDEFTSAASNQAKETAKDNEAKLTSMVGQAKRSELSVLIELDGENAFTRPRLEMVAPSSFYRHELATAQSFGALQRGALIPLMLQQIDLYAEYRNKLSAAIIELEQERDARSWTAFTKEMVQASKGDIYQTKREMQLLLDKINVVESALKDALNVRPASSESRGATSRMLDFIKAQMLASLTSLTRNVFTGVGFSRAFAESVLKGQRPVGVVRVAPHVLATVADVAGAIFTKSPSIARWIERNQNGPLRVVMQRLANSAQQITAARNYIGTDGYTLKQDLAFRALGDSAFARSEFGQSGASRAAEAFLSAPALRHIYSLMTKIVDRQERLTNILSIKAFDDQLRGYFYNLSKIIDQRIVEGRPDSLDFSKPQNRFTAKELESIGITPSTWAKQLRLFNTTKTLEQLAMDYHQRLQQAKASGQNWTTLPSKLGENIQIRRVANQDVKNWTMVPFTEDQGIYGDMIDALGKLNNLSALSNRPAITRARTQFGDVAREAVLFPGFANGFLSTLQLMQMVHTAQDIPKRRAEEVGNLLLLAALLIAIGIPTAELSKWIYRVYYGRPYPAETISDLLTGDVTPERLARITGAAMATTIPYLGEYIASAMGAQNYKAAATDLANMSLPLKLATSFYDTAKSLAQTGDVGAAAINTARNFTPGLNPLINRLPAVQARNAAADAVRVAKVNRGELEVSERGGGGYGGQQTEFGSTINKALAASAAGDMDLAKSYIDKATKLKADAGDANPQAAVRNAIQSRRPEYKAFGRKLSDTEKSSLIGRMSSGQRNVFMKAEGAASRLLEMTPTKSQLASSGASGGIIGRVNKRISAIKKSTQPKALRAINKKIKSLKPKKLKLAKVKAASGSKLLRPRARAKGASVLLPAV
jgi:hypothetical protein